MSNARPYKPCEPGTAKELARQLVYHPAIGNPEKAAEAGGKSRSQVSAYCDTDSDQQATLPFLLALQDKTKTTLVADFVAAASGGRFVPHAASPGQLVDCLKAVAQELGDYVATSQAAAADGDICAKDRRDIRLAVEELVRALGALGLKLEEKPRLVAV